MPEVKDSEGNVIANLPYTDEGMEQAKDIIETNPRLDIEYAPGGMLDGAARSVKNYAGGGLTGFSKIGQQIPNQPRIVPPMEENLVNPLAGNVPMYKEGGKVKKK